MSDLFKLLFTTILLCALLTSPTLLAQETPLAEKASDSKATKPSLDELMARFAEIEKSYLPFHIEFSELLNGQFGPFLEETKAGETGLNPAEYRAQRGHKDSQAWMLESTVENQGVSRTERIVHSESGLHRKETSPEQLDDTFDDGSEPQIHSLEGVFPLKFGATSPIFMSEYFDTVPDQFTLRWHGDLACVTCHYHPTTSQRITIELWLDPHFSWHPVFMRRYLHDAREPYPDEWKVTEFRVLRENVRVSAGEFMGPIRRPHGAKDKRIVFLRCHFQILKSAYQDRVPDAVFSPETPIGGTPIHDLEPIGGELALVTSYQKAEKMAVTIFSVNESDAKAREAMETPAVLNADNEQLKIFKLQNANVKDVARVIKQIYGGPSFALESNEQTNSLVVHCGQSELEQIETVIRRLDTRPGSVPEPFTDSYPIDAVGRPNNAQVASTASPEESTLHAPIAPQAPEPDVLIDDAEIADRLLPLTLELDELRTKLGYSHPKVIALERRLAFTRDFLNKFAQESQKVRSSSDQIKIFNLKNSNATDAAQILRQLFNDVTVSLDNRTNALIVRATELQLHEIEAVLLRLDSTETAVKNSETTNQPSIDANTPVTSIAEYRRQLDALEQPVLQLAEQVRAAETKHGKDHPDSEKLRADLRALVQQTFAARQEIQRAELGEFTRRLQRMQQSIDSRDRIVDQIVERRIAELLDPEASWNTQ